MKYFFENMTRIPISTFYSESGQSLTEVLSLISLFFIFVMALLNLYKSEKQEMRILFLRSNSPYATDFISQINRLESCWTDGRWSSERIHQRVADASLNPSQFWNSQNTKNGFFSETPYLLANRSQNLSLYMPHVAQGQFNPDHFSQNLQNLSNTRKILKFSSCFFGFKGQCQQTQNHIFFDDKAYDSKNYQMTLCIAEGTKNCLSTGELAPVCETGALADFSASAAVGRPADICPTVNRMIKSGGLALQRSVLFSLWNFKK